MSIASLTLAFRAGMEITFDRIRDTLRDDHDFADDLEIVGEAVGVLVGGPVPAIGEFLSKLTAAKATKRLYDRVVGSPPENTLDRQRKIEQAFFFLFYSAYFEALEKTMRGSTSIPGTPIPPTPFGSASPTATQQRT